GQGVGAGVAAGGAGLAEVLGRGAVQACAGDQAILLGAVPSQFAEYPIVVEVRVLGPGLPLVRVDAHAAALAVFVGLCVDAADQLHVGPVPGGLDPRTEGATIDIADHRHAHH